LGTTRDDQRVRNADERAIDELIDMEKAVSTSAYTDEEIFEAELQRIFCDLGLREPRNRDRGGGRHKTSYIGRIPVIVSGREQRNSRPD
jgi:hypothetical protein